MSDPLLTEHHVAAQLAEKLGGLNHLDTEWLQRVFRCFPVPTALYSPYVLKSLGRIVEGVPWAAELLAHDDFLDHAARLIPQVMLLAAGESPVYPRLGEKQLADGFRGRFLLAGTLLGRGSGSAPKGLEALRVALVACQWRWVDSDNPRGSAIDDLASAIRGAGGSSLEDMLLLQLGQASSLTQFLSAAQGIAQSGHSTLASVWRNHIDPELRGQSRPARLPKPEMGAESPDRLSPAASAGESPTGTAVPPIPRSQDGQRKPRSPSGSTTKSDEEERFIVRLQGGIRRGFGPSPRASPEPLLGEMLEEVTPRVLTSPLPEAAAHDDARSTQRYQVQQAIWNTNYLLLPNHPDVLPLADYLQVVTSLLSQLDEAPAEPDLSAGTCGLLVQALTGRVPRTFRSLAVLDDSAKPHDPRRIELLLHEGAFRLSSFWQVGDESFERSYFRPDQDESLHLEPARPDFLLLVEPRFMQLLRANADALRAFTAMPVDEIEARLRLAARRVSETLCMHFTPGQLRSSFATHLFEQCRDTAATQLICADTLGQSVAPLSYYAPQARELARIHWTFQNRLLGTEDPLPVYPLADERVGAHLLVKIGSAHELARAPASILHYGLSRLLDGQRTVDVHRALVSHTAGMLMAVATHRPTEALLGLTLSDIWIDGDTGAALFRDKVHDAAHDPRLVALSATVCRQLNAYLEHLVGLSERVPGVAAQVKRILQGKAPLFMGLSNQGQPEYLNLTMLKDCMPAVWRALPMNWGRHWMRTHAVEQGMRPELVSMQLGHLEAVGYPFSGASPTEPWRFVQDVAEGWEILARAQGWQVVRGIPASTAVAPITLTPLRPWAASIAKHQTRQRAVARQWREAMRAKLRAYREQAENTALAHPELVKTGIIRRYLDPRSGLDRHALTRADFERIRDEVYEVAGDDIALAIANANAVCKIARTVNARTRQKPETPGPVQHLRRPLDNAFVPGMMSAVRQINALRDHVTTLVGDAPRGRWADMASACACAALAMVLFGYCESPDQIRGAISRRCKIQRSASLQDLVLVPWGDKPHEVIALRGVAAIVLARLSWKRGKDDIPEWDEVEARLAELLPAWALSRKAASGAVVASDLIARLCETAAVAHRYELSPAARRANAVRGGSTPANLMEQLAFIDGDPAGTVQRSWEEQENPSRVGELSHGSLVRKGNARSQYNKLCAVFPNITRDTELPLTGAKIASGEVATPQTYARVVAEIEAQMQSEEPEHRLHPIVLMLARWTVDMLVNGTPRKDGPALSTVETHLNRIGGSLVYIFGQSSMADVDEGELEAAYQATIESKGLLGSTHQKAAAAVLLFHQFAQADCGLPEIDLSGVKLHLGADPEALADARLILPAERTAIFRDLASRAEAASVSATGHEVRVLRQAAQVAPLFALAGLRRGEALGLQFRDVVEAEGSLRARIRPNGSRRLKTVSGRRVVEIPAKATVQGGLTLGGWVEVERSRLRARSLQRAYIFSPADAPSDAKVRGQIAEVCLQSCRTVTGRRLSRLHSFRHLVAMERTTPVFLSDEDRVALEEHVQLAAVPTLHAGVALPRDLMGQVVSMGHADPATTLTFYHHLPWLLRSRSDAWLAARYVNRSTLAPLMGVTLHTLDWAVKQRPGRDRGLAWLDVAITPREIPNAPMTPIAPAPSGGKAEATSRHPRWNAQSLTALLDDVGRVGSLEKSLLVRGEDPGEAGPLRLQLLPMERRLGRRLLEERGRTTPTGAPRRAIRRVDKGRQLEKLPVWFDADEGGRRAMIAELAEQIYEYLDPSQGDRIYLPPGPAQALQQLLSDLGITESRIIMETDATGLAVLRIRRAEPPSGPDMEGLAAERFLGLILKRALLIIRLAAHCSAVRPPFAH